MGIIPKNREEDFCFTFYLLEPHPNASPSPIDAFLNLVKMFKIHDR